MDDSTPIQLFFLFLVVHEHHNQCEVEYDRNDTENDLDFLKHTFLLLKSVIQTKSPNPFP